MQKPISKTINGKQHYARKFSLAGVNEMNAVTVKMQVGDSAISRSELAGMMTKTDENGETVTLSTLEVAQAAQDAFKIPMASVMLHQAAMRSLRLRHSLCSADGVLKYKSVAQLEDSIEADEADDLLALVDEANPVKTVAVELEDAEKN